MFCNLFYCVRLHHRSLFILFMHFMYCISICILSNCNFEGQVLLCVALMNHYFCTCFVHLIKKNMLCSSNATSCPFNVHFTVQDCRLVTWKIYLHVVIFSQCAPVVDGINQQRELVPYTANCVRTIHLTSLTCKSQLFKYVVHTV